MLEVCSGKADVIESIWAMRIKQVIGRRRETRKNRKKKY
jgi:hypothetical protein